MAMVQAKTRMKTRIAFLYEDIRVVLQRDASARPLRDLARIPERSSAVSPLPTADCVFSRRHRVVFRRPPRRPPHPPPPHAPHPTAAALSLPATPRGPLSPAEVR